MDIKELDANLLNRLISKIIISEPQKKDGTENYRRTPETVTMEIHFNLKPIPELGTTFFNVGTIDDVIAKAKAEENRQ